MRTRFFLLQLILILWGSCKKDEPPEKQPDIPPVIAPKGGVFITNEGNYTYGNASVSYYKNDSGVVTEDIFKQANNRPLGDVCQSMEIYNGKAYIVVNNSGKIEVVNPQDFKTIAVISGLTSPRYFLPVSNSKAYTTDLKSNSIAVINLSSNTITKQISCPGWTEELILANNKAFVTNMYKEYVYVVNTSTDILEDSIKVGFAPSSIRKDANGKLWVLCGGSSSNNIKASLHKINPSTKQVELSLNFPNQSDSPAALEINGTGDVLYYLNKGVFKFDINHTALPTTSFIAQNNRLFYGLGIEPGAGTIYVSDAIDYVQKGIIFRYKPDGTLINSFKAGIIPGDFYFYF